MPRIPAVETRFNTVELKINFLRAVQWATLTAEARVVKASSALGYVECDVKDQTGRLIALQGERT